MSGFFCNLLLSDTVKQIIYTLFVRYIWKLQKMLTIFVRSNIKKTIMNTLTILGLLAQGLPAVFILSILFINRKTILNNGNK